MNQNAPKLDKAVALYYDGEHAPIITAKGVNDQAKKILEQARQHNIPLCESAELTQLLMTLELGENIPEHLYQAVAFILSFAFQMSGKQP